MHLISDELAHQLGLKEANSRRGRSTHRSGSGSSSDSSPSPCPRKMKKAWKMWRKCHPRPAHDVFAPGPAHPSQTAYAPGPAHPSQTAYAPGPAHPSQTAYAPVPAFHPGFYPGGRRFWKICPDVHVHLNSSHEEVVDHEMRKMVKESSQPGLPVNAQPKSFIKKSSDVQPGHPIDAQFVSEEIPRMIESILAKNSSSNDDQPGHPVNSQTENFLKSEIDELLSMSLGDLLKLKAQAKASSPLI